MSCRASRRSYASGRRYAERLNRRGFKTHIADAESDETKLLVRRDRIEVKVEANLVMRGTVHPARRAAFTPAAREVLLADVEIPVVSREDLYGGKLCAALGRQHPRDLFDVMQPSRARSPVPKDA